MKQFHKRYLLYCFLIIGVLSLTFFLWNTYHPNDKPAFLTEETASQTSFDHFTNQLFLSEVNASTLTLHYTLANPKKYGIDQYPITFGDYSEKAITDRIHDMESAYSYLSGINRDGLTKKQKLTYDILSDYYTTEMSAVDLNYYSEILSPTCGVQAQLPVLLAEYTFYTEQDIKDYLSLLGKLDEYYQSIIAFETKKSQEGLFMPDYAADDIIDQCKEFLKDPENSYLIKIFDEKLDSFKGLSDKEKTAYKEQNKTLFYSDVIPAYQTLIDGLSTLKGTGKNEQGLCYYPNGKRYYEYLVKYSTGSSKTVVELEKLTEAQTYKDLNSLLHIAKDNPAALTAASNYSFSLSDPGKIIEDLRKKIDKDFPAPPKVPYSVKYVPEALQKYASPAFYLTPTIDETNQNTIYINSENKLSKLDLYTTLAHEGYPGHLYQNTYFDSTKPNEVRSVLNYGGYSEGWATYVEMLSYSYADMDPTVSSLLQLNNAIMLSLYARMDMGIHYDGWGLSEIENYLKQFGIDNPDAAQDIYHIIVEEPANYLQYYIGYLEFLSLRDSAKEALGTEFNLKKFHQFILEIGPAPFGVISKYQTDWINAQKKNQ